AHGEWKDNNIKSSNQREMTVILKALLEYRQELIYQQSIGIRLLTDNTVTMYCLNKGKGSIIIAPLVDKVLKLVEQYNWIIEASHIPDLLNTIPDSLSRLSRCGDYAIRREVLQKTFKELGIQISIEIFAIRANRQCTRYCNTSKDKFAVKRKGFDLQWSKEVPLLHSPISQLLKTIREIKKKQVPIAVVIAPDWPNQKWFTELREITTQKICLGESTQQQKNGEKLFRKLLPARGLSSNAVDRVISNWFSQWRTYIVGLTLLLGYLKKIRQQPDYLLNLDQLQIFMTTYLEEAINQKCPDNSVKNQRCALAVLLKFIGYSEQQIHSYLVKQLMRKIRMELRQTDKEKPIWDLDILLNYIKAQVPLLEQNALVIQQRRAIAATLVMVFTVARLAELHRATLLSTPDDEYIIQTTILKSSQRIAEFKICNIPDERICSLRWFKSWFADREPNIPNKAQELWRVSHAEKYILADDLSKAIRTVMQSAGISKTYSVTSIRAAAITKLLKHNVSSVKVDRFTHHSDTASTVRQYYDKNNNVEAREVHGQMEEELDNEEDEEQERTLFEENEYKRSNVDQRIQSPVGVLCLGLSNLEFFYPLSGNHLTQSQSSIEAEDTFQPLIQYFRTPTEVIDDQKAQQDAANAEEVALLLGPFNVVRVNKQSKSSLSPQEVVYNLQEQKQSSGRDMSSSFFLPNQDVPTLGNLGQTESSEVQTQSSADEEHEAQMIKQKENDDS
ncbi:MAG: hypothetical protein EZS28_021606, partial [Streblomastix strix]